MTAEHYYRRALWMPLIVPIISACSIAVMIYLGGRPTDSLSGFVDTAQFLVIAGLFSLVPYGVFVGVVMLRGGRHTESEWRRLSWLAPSYIAGPFALGVGLIALPMSGPRGALTTAWFLGLVALATGYGYAVLVNGGLKALRFIGCVAPPAASE